MIAKHVLCFLLFSAVAAGCKSTCKDPATPNAASEASYQRDGFVVEEVDGRLWVFRAGSEALTEYRQHGEPAKSVTRIGVGPGGMTLRGPDTETLDAYQKAR
jgi:hypothetical protein